uniref:Formamidase n=1 Tax=Ignisphaera aggregans TaxID=334771 RepID=A0A7C5TM73_9CREN
MVKKIPSSYTIYSFSPDNKPVERVSPGEIVVFETLDALGGQIKSENTTLSSIDWSRVNPATGPLYIEGAEPGDAIVVNILDIDVDDRAIIVVIPDAGVLRYKKFRPRVKIMPIVKGRVLFNGIKLIAKPMIGVIGVSPSNGAIPTGTSGSHGGNMDVAEIAKGSRVYLPVFVKGALLAIGDLHALQADGEICVAAAEVPGNVTVKVELIKGKKPVLPIVETQSHIHVIGYGETLDEAAYRATEVAVEALMKEHSITFEEAYMLASLAVDLKINQAVDPAKGVRASIPKNLISIDSLLQ